MIRKTQKNYFLVSLTSILCKIMESIAKDHLVKHISKHKNILSNKQYGFLPGRSTILQLLNVPGQWTEAIDNGIYVDVIPGSILESKGMGAIFHKKGKEILQKGKIFENLGKNVQNLKIF